MFSMYTSSLSFPCIWWRYLPFLCSSFKWMWWLVQLVRFKWSSRPCAVCQLKKPLVWSQTSTKSVLLKITQYLFNLRFLVSKSGAWPLYAKCCHWHHIYPLVHRRSSDLWKHLATVKKAKSVQIARFQMKEMDELHDFFGIERDHLHTSKDLLFQCHYIVSLFFIFRMVGCKLIPHLATI